MSQTPEETALDRIHQAADSGAESLDLSNLGVTSLPDELWNLQNLKELDVSDNYLTFISQEIRQLKNLVKLKLGNAPTIFDDPERGRNQITSLPPEIGQLSNLTQLDLSRNKLASLPSEIGQFTNLIELKLSKNELTSLPPEIGQLNNLTYLDLRENLLVSLPPEIGQLSNLTLLILYENQLASLPPSIGQLANLTELDLRGNKLTNLLPEIGQLTNLKELDLAGNHIINLPPEIGQLINLARLILPATQLANLPPEIRQLTNLIELKICNNQLTSLPPEIGQLTNLRLLDLRENQLTSLPSEIGQLTSLTELHISRNQLTSLSPEIVQLTNLTRLDLFNNQLTNLPPEIVQLTNLRYIDLTNNQLNILSPDIGQLIKLKGLYLSKNQLVNLPPEIGQLTNLTELTIVENQLTSLPSEIGQLTTLTVLNLNGNQLTSLPHEIDQLTNLTSLSLSSNELTSMPLEFCKLTDLTVLDLSNNQLTSLPSEIINLYKLKEISLEENPLEIAIPAKWLDDWASPPHAQEILAHYKRIYEEGGRELGEARVLVVGDGRVGKTSVVRRLIDNTFNDKEDTTLIVEKRPLPLGDVRAQVWDFGGQEHMHATHQFFFSGRSLYLLVFDTGKTVEQNNIEYWLTFINAYNQNAPVILVGNKCDQHEMDIEKRRLREKYPNIRGFVSTSASTGEHIEELRQKIQEEVRAMPQVRVLFSADYLAVKEEMESLSVAHISHEEFVRICERHGVSDEKDQDTLLDLLHDLGAVLYFRDKGGNPLLPALGVLNPNWVTGGVYRIITNPALKDKFKGRLTMSLMREILSAPEYSRHIEDIAKLLERFELCYRADDSSYWMPSLMERDEPAALGDFTSAMKFEYWYPELPKSVIVRFIVKSHKMILDNKVWRYGAVLKLYGNTALVRADERDKRVSIYITGEESTRRDVLAILRAQFDDIHAMFATPPEAFIYPPQYPDLRLPFADMKTLAKTEREHKAVYQGKPVTINLRELLDGFVTPQERRKDEEREEKEVGRRGDIHINIGNNQGGSVIIGDSNTSNIEIQNSFNGFSPETQTALLELMNLANELMQKSTDAKVKEIIKDELEDLQKQAKKSEPVKEKVVYSVDRLAKAAKNLNDVGKPVLELATTVIKLINNLP